MKFPNKQNFTTIISRGSVAVLAIVIFAIFAATLPAFAQTEHVLFSFCPTGGWCPGGEVPEGVIADSAGNLYGTTYYGGTGVGGVAFRWTPSGEESTLYNFTRAGDNGWRPEGPLIVDQQGNLYGATSDGGANSIHFRIGDGTTFKLSPDGTETTLYNFGAYKTDGAQPEAGLVRDAKGNFYGTTFWGGVNLYGTVFGITFDGVETILHEFANDSVDGINPTTSLVMDHSGNLYGTTQSGGSHGIGTVFEVTAAGSYSILYNFNPAQGDGVLPIGGLTLDSQGNIYGTTFRVGDVEGQTGGGTVFKLTPGSNGSWTRTTLYKFSQQPGTCQNPQSNLLFDAQGNLYGTASYGGTWGGGCAFKLSPNGKLTVLHAFGASGDGIAPVGNIVFFQGNLFGTTVAGGAYSEGTIFEVTP